MIRNKEPLSMVEAVEIVKKTGKEETELAGFVKKFTSLDAEKAKELRKKLEELNLLKVKPEHIAKIIDLLPETPEELNKIFVDLSLDEDETKKVLDTIKEYK